MQGHQEPRGGWNVATVQLVRFDADVNAISLDFVAGGREHPSLGARAAAPGEPFNVKVMAPGSLWGGAAVSALERWAESGILLWLRLSEGSGGPKATLTDRDTTVTFDLLATSSPLPLMLWPRRT